MKICLFSSTPDIEDLNFIVRVLTGELEELLNTAKTWGYDGIEFLPDPLNVPELSRVERAIKESGAAIPVLNTGRLAVQNLTLFNEDPKIRTRAMDSFKNILDLAGQIHARVGLGVARGVPDRSLSASDLDRLADEIFHEMTEHAEAAGAVIMLEPIDPGANSIVATMHEAMSWVRRIDSENFTVMLDTYQLLEVEDSFTAGIEKAGGRATHIHLYDPSRWPPGVLPENQRLDWPGIIKSLKDTNFSGTGSVVLAPDGDPDDTAPRAVSYLKRLFKN